MIMIMNIKMVMIIMTIKMVMTIKMIKMMMIADIYISISMETFEHRKYKIRGDEGIN